MNDSDILNEFYLDSQTHIESIEAAILYLESNLSDSNSIDTIFRSVHSIKGNAGVLGLTSIYEEGQVFESFLEIARERKKAEPEEIDTMLDKLDRLKKMLGESHVCKVSDDGEDEAKIDFEQDQDQDADSSENSDTNDHQDAEEITQPEVKNSADEIIEDLSLSDMNLDNAIDSQSVKGSSDQSEILTAKISESKEQSKQEIDRTFLIFTLDSQRYGINILDVREIIIKDLITPVPNSLGFVEGVMNLRDQIIVVFNLKKKLKIYNLSSSLDSNNVIIVEVEGIPTGLSIDTVLGIVSVNESNIDMRDIYDSRGKDEYIKGFARTKDGAIIIVNVEHLCLPDEVLY